MPWFPKKWCVLCHGETCGPESVLAVLVQRHILQVSQLDVADWTNKVIHIFWKNWLSVLGHPVPHPVLNIGDENCHQHFTNKALYNTIILYVSIWDTSLSHIILLFLTIFSNQCREVFLHARLTKFSISISQNITIKAGRNYIGLNWVYDFSFFFWGCRLFPRVG